MSIGMSWKDFWTGDVKMAPAYRKADKLRLKQSNYEMWLQGRYIYDALLEVSPMFRTTFKRTRIVPHDYNAEPYPITEEEIRARQERKARAEMERMKQQFMEFASRVRPRTESADERRSVESAEEKNADRD